MIGENMKYQVVIAGFGGQGVVFLVKVLALCAGDKNLAFLGTENHGMSQRGGAVSCFIKVGDFSNPVIDKAQADLLIGLDKNETLRNLSYLKKSGVVVTNASDFPKIPFECFMVDANKKALENLFPINALNVFMLGVSLKNVKNFPFSVEEIKEALKKINPKVYEQNIKILEQGLNYA
jgi:indolepyruvate ferredoxin oxidoreductase beta subunit